MKQKTSERPDQPSQFEGADGYRKAILYTGAVLVSLVVIIVVAVSFAMTLSTSGKRLLLDEGGIVETASVCLYLLVAAALVFAGILQLFAKKGSEKKRLVGPQYPWLLAALVSCFAARELDFHKAFTTMSVMKTRFFISDYVSIYEKLIAIMVLSAIALLVIRLATIYVPRIFARFKSCQLQGVLPVLALLLVVFSKGLDVGAGTLLRSGVVIQATLRSSVQATEEISELFIPIVFLVMTAITLAPVFARLQSKPKNETVGRIDSLKFAGTNSSSAKRAA